MLLRVGVVVPTDAPPVFDALLHIEAGRIVSLAPWPVHKPPGDYVDRGQWGLLPGLVNAHCHLELSCLRGVIEPTATFSDWLRRLLAEIGRYTEAQRRAGAAEGLAELAESGTTTVLDIANTDHAWEPSRRSGLRVHWFRELLGWRWPARWVSWRAARRSWSEHPDSDRLIAHVSPHAPYSAHPRLIVKAAKWAYRHGKRWGIHLAETVEELDLLATGGGPMRDFLGDFLGWNWRPSRMGALEHLAQISWPRACPPLLFHANHLTAREFDLAARLGVAVVHCPGSHRYFGRTTFPLAEFLSRGIPVFLGTDSLASNQRLDMRREVRLLVEMHPEVGCEAALRMAGRDAAAWLSGATAPVGLTPGAPADLWWWRLPQSRGLAGPTEALLERLLSISEASSEVWIAGQAVPARRNLNLYSSP